jgi:TctA family transporter
MLVLGVIGWLMKMFGFDRAPFLIGFVLSLPLERYYYLTANLYELEEWIVRPGVLIMAAVLVLPVVMAVIRMIRARKNPALKEAPDVDDEEEPASRRWAVVMSASFLVLFLVAFLIAQGFAPTARLMPAIATFIGAALALASLIVDIRRLKRDGPLVGEEAPPEASTPVEVGSQQ